MSEQTKTELPGGECRRGVSWYPMRSWWQMSRLFNEGVGLPPLLQARDPQWTDAGGLQRYLEACSWPGYVPSPLFVAHVSGTTTNLGQKIDKEEHRWRVSLDMGHFSPSEISVRVRDGFLEVRGQHEERPDEYGFIARCFTRKYRLPDEADVSKLQSSISVAGILTVEAPVPETSVPAAIVIPIQVESEVTGEKGEKEEDLGKDAETVFKIPEDQDLPSVEDEDGKSPAGVLGEGALPGSSAAGLEQQEERRGQGEETQEEPAAEYRPSVPTYGEDTESPGDSSQQPDALLSGGGPDTETPKDVEREESAVTEEVAAGAGSGGRRREWRGGGGEVSQQRTEPPSQELKDPDVKQEDAHAA